jgi:thioredoxin reductase (NADPH)
MALMVRAYTQAQKFGAEMAIPDEAVRLECSSGAGARFQLRLANRERVTARAVVIACGARYRRLEVPDLGVYEGSGVHYWASPLESKLCSGQEVALGGAGNSAGQAVVFLASAVAKVWLLARGRSLEASMSRYLVDRISGLPNVEVLPETQVVAVEGQGGVLEAIRWRQLPSGEDAPADPPPVPLHRRGAEHLVTVRLGRGAGREWIRANGRGRGAGPSGAGDEPRRRVRDRRRAVRLDEARRRGGSRR